MDFLKIREECGLIHGYVLGLGTGAISFMRRSRMFHPRGLLYSAEVRALENTPFAHSLEGEAMIRFSSAWWKKKEWIDVLGIALRFRGKQDLLFATVEHPALLPVAPFFTQFHDFLENTYFAVSPFSIPDRTPVKFRLAPVIPSVKNDEISKLRSEKLDRMVQNGEAAFYLEIKEMSPGSTAWKPIARIQVMKSLNQDQEAILFSPFRVGLGIHPRGYIHFLRVGAYRMSQAARPKKSMAP